MIQLLTLSLKRQEDDSYMEFNIKECSEAEKKAGESPMILNYKSLGRKH
jgi:hypothetical protein